LERLTVKLGLSEAMLVQVQDFFPLLDCIAKDNEEKHRNVTRPEVCIV
jgi:hypothetical protein